MPIDQRVKDRAHVIDPDAWVSYSGKPKDFKQRTEIRRNQSLQDARRQLVAEGVNFTPGESRLDEIIDELRTDNVDIVGMADRLAEALEILRDR